MKIIKYDEINFVSLIDNTADWIVPDYKNYFLFGDSNHDLDVHNIRNLLKLSDDFILKVQIVDGKYHILITSTIKNMDYDLCQQLEHDLAEIIHCSGVYTHREWSFEYSIDNWRRHEDNRRHAFKPL